MASPVIILTATEQCGEETPKCTIETRFCANLAFEGDLDFLFDALTRIEKIVVGIRRGVRWDEIHLYEGQ